MKENKSSKKIRDIAKKMGDTELENLVNSYHSDEGAPDKETLTRSIEKYILSKIEAYEEAMDAVIKL